MEKNFPSRIPLNKAEMKAVQKLQEMTVNFFGTINGRLKAEYEINFRNPFIFSQ